VTTASTPRSVDPLGAVILTGGGGVRLGGVDKASIEVGGTTLLERALAATAAAGETVVVGAELPTSRPVTFAREEPPGGGPGAGLLTGLERFSASPALVCVLAVDMPGFTSATLARLAGVLEAEAGAPYDGACLLDDQGREQWLAGVYRTAALRTVVPEPESWHGFPVRRLMLPLGILAVPAVADEARDVDTWEDLLRARQPFEL
jgi:molybdopterin-guanine dinucleotide biosynthesis protein A